MLTPAEIDQTMFAPCGMNCMVCYKHLGPKPCKGCLGTDDTKPASCRACRIRACAQGKGFQYCFQCPEFPCKRLRSLDKSYRTRYGVSLVEFGRCASLSGAAACMREQIARFTCTDCGGLISLHDGICSECKKQYPLGRSRDQ